MHHTANEILITGDPDRIYQLASAVEEWPLFLPHYRWVRVHGREGNRRTVEMAAWRTGIPVRWLSHQWLWPEERRITFRHIGGLSRGMDVEWRIEVIDRTGDAVMRSRQEGSTGRARSCKGTGGPIIDRAGHPLTLSPPHPLTPSPPLVRVSITHDMRLEVPVVRTPPGQWVVGELFVKAVAGRTLACLKQRVEEEA
jgi:ribosome-associated toxin RatA of RatAB toxin-antitoxin module